LGGRKTVQKKGSNGNLFGISLPKRENVEKAAETKRGSRRRGSGKVGDI